jgi:AraC-like DNA-binding protein
MEDFWIQHRVNKSNFKIHRHIEHRYQVVLVLNGKIRYTVGDNEYIAAKGDMVVLNTLENHILEVISYPYERYILQIDPSFFQREVKYPEIISIFIRRPAGFSHMFNLSDEIFDFTCLCLDEMEREHKDRRVYWEMIIGSNLRRMFVTIFRACSTSFYTGKIDAGITLAFQIQNYLDHNYTENLSVDDISSRFFLNKHYLSHVFKDVTGYGMMEYVIFLRMNKAKILLAQTGESISLIASKCGYTNFTHFSRQFRKLEECTPSEYRKKWLEMEEVDD